jgi:hypothetical protein
MAAFERCREYGKGPAMRMHAGPFFSWRPMLVVIAIFHAETKHESGGNSLLSLKAPKQFFTKVR